MEEAEKERVCVASAMQHYGAGQVGRRCITMEWAEKRVSESCISNATLGTGQVREMLHHHGRAELGTG